jgi:formylglycine-generating enzyme required for sulfatase activity
MKSKQQITLTVLLAAGLIAIILTISSCGSGQPPGFPGPNTPTSALGIGSTQTSPKGGMVMVYVPAGEFLMGSVYSDEPQESETARGLFNVEYEYQQHKVYLDDYWID